MSTDWSDTIVISELSDEPAFSEELGAITEQAQKHKGRVPHVVLNFAQVSYLNSSNLAQLLRLRKVLTERSAQLRLCCVNETVWSIFTVTGLDKVFRTAPDPMTALAALQIVDGQGA